MKCTRSFPSLEDTFISHSIGCKLDSLLSKNMHINILYFTENVKNVKKMCKENSLAVSVDKSECYREARSITAYVRGIVVVPEGFIVGEEMVRGVVSRG